MQMGIEMKYGDDDSDPTKKKKKKKRNNVKFVYKWIFLQFTPAFLCMIFFISFCSYNSYTSAFARRFSWNEYSGGTCSFDR